MRELDQEINAIQKDWLEQINTTSSATTALIMILSPESLVLMFRLLMKPLLEALLEELDGADLTHVLYSSGDLVEFPEIAQKTQIWWKSRHSCSVV